MRYIILLAYDGLAYHGWQVQPHYQTVAGTLCHAFQSAFFTDVKLLGASRTDAGVHALGQVVLATTDLELEPEILQRAWNARLPKDIHIRAIQIAPEEFHPLKNVVQKTYYYHIFTGRPLPFIARYCAKCTKPLDIERLKDGLQVFVGTHDFRSFCTGDEAATTVRTIDSVDLVYVQRWGAYRIVVKGKSFLHHMIRRIVGATLDIATSMNRSIDELHEALEAHDPQ